MSTVADGIPVQNDQEVAPPTLRVAVPLTEQDLVQLQQRMDFMDGTDLVDRLVHELVELSLVEADAVYVERRLMAHAAKEMTAQVFLVIAACTPSLQPEKRIELPSVRPREDPPQCVLDAFCRHEIDTKSPPPPQPTRPSTSQKAKRPTVTSSLAASAVLDSPPASRGLSFRSAASFKPMQPGSPHTPEPGVPFSIEPAEPMVSPRKTMALLKAAVRVASARPKSPVSEALAEQEQHELPACVEVVADPLPSRAVVPSPRKRSVNGGSSSPSSWSIILPSNPAMLPDEDAAGSSSVSVEFVLPRRHSGERLGLPELIAHAPPTMPVSDGSRERNASVCLPPADESEVLTVDAMGTLGCELRTRVSLSAGVRMQSQGSELVQMGPALPVFATKMRRATFLDEAFAHELVTLTLAASASPTRPLLQRPSTIPGSTGDASPSSSSLGKSSTSSQSSGVFTLTECPSTSLAKMVSPSVHSLAHSSLSTTSTSTATTSLKANLFRKPSKVARPCTALSQCCNGSGPCTTGNTETSSTTLAHADLVKQRAFQRKPSFVTNASPPKKSQSRRSIVHPSNNSKPVVPVASRELRYVSIVATQN